MFYAAGYLVSQLHGWLVVLVVGQLVNQLFSRLISCLFACLVIQLRSQSLTQFLTCSLPAGARDFSLLQKIQIVSGAMRPHIQRVQSFFPGVKWPELKVNYLHLLSRLIVSGVIPLLPYMLLWHGEGKNKMFTRPFCKYFYDNVINH